MYVFSTLWKTMGRRPCPSVNLFCTFQEEGEWPMERKLRLGVLGLGEGRSIISAGLSSPRWEVAALCDLDRELGRTRCHEFGLDCFTERYESMLEDGGIDVIGVYTPDNLHAQHVIAALDAGKHVICTKPLLPGMRDAVRLLDAVRRSGRLLFVGQSSRFFEPMIHQRRDFERGRHGELLTVEAHYNADHRWFLRERAWAPGGLKWLYGGLSHPVDHVRWYMPDIEEVMGYGLLSPGSRELGHTSPDTMHFDMRARSGKIARVSGIYGSPTMNTERQDHMSCILRGTAGASESNYSSLKYYTSFSGEPPAELSFPDKVDHYFRFEGHTHHAGEYQNYLDYFAACLEEGAVPHPDAAEGVGTVAVMAAMERSLETGAPVRVSAVLEESGLGPLSA
jgi:predicted dehydrogenase